MTDPNRLMVRMLAVMAALMVAAAPLSADTAWAARSGYPGPNSGDFTPGSDANGDHCPAPPPIGDLNVFYGVSWRIVTQSGFCGPVAAGEFWSPAALWTVNTTFKSVPKEFTPAGAAPLDDFVAKFVAVKYVVDPGTSQVKTTVVPKSARLWTGDFFGQPSVNTVTLGPLQPPNPGHHVVDVYWELSAMHCDGFGKDVADHCLPAGTTLLYTIPFDVTTSAP